MGEVINVSMIIAMKQALDALDEFERTGNSSSLRSWSERWHDEIQSEKEKLLEELQDG